MSDTTDEIVRAASASTLIAGLDAVRTTDATLNAGLDKLRAIANGQVVKISPLQASLVLDYVRAGRNSSYY